MSFYEVIAFFHGWKQTEIIRNSQNVNIGFGNGPISVSYLLPSLLFAPQNSIPSKLEKNRSVLRYSYKLQIYKPLYNV